MLSFTRLHSLVHRAHQTSRRRITFSSFSSTSLDSKPIDKDALKRELVRRGISFSSNKKDELMQLLVVDVLDNAHPPPSSIRPTAISSSSYSSSPPPAASSSYNYKLQFDGGSRGNPSPESGFGWCFYRQLLSPSSYSSLPSSSLPPPQLLPYFSHYEYLGNLNRSFTNNEAEYMALQHFLMWFSTNFDPSNDSNSNLTIEGDSLLVINQVTNKWKVKSDNLIDLSNDIKAMLRTIEKFNPVVNWIERAENSKADSLANLAMDAKKSGGGYVEY